MGRHKTPGAAPAPAPVKHRVTPDRRCTPPKQEARAEAEWSNDIGSGAAEALVGGQVVARLELSGLATLGALGVLDAGRLCINGRGVGDRGRGDGGYRRFWRSRCAAPSAEL